MLFLFVEKLAVKGEKSCCSTWKPSVDKHLQNINTEWYWCHLYDFLRSLCHFTKSKQNEAINTAGTIGVEKTHTGLWVQEPCSLFRQHDLFRGVSCFEHAFKGWHCWKFQVFFSSPFFFLSWWRVANSGCTMVCLCLYIYTVSVSDVWWGSLMTSAQSDVQTYGPTVLFIHHWIGNSGKCSKSHISIHCIQTDELRETLLQHHY